MELCQDRQLRSLWPPAAMATMPIQLEESFCCGIVGSTQDRASASVEFETKLKMEEKRQAGKRALAFPFIPKWVDYSSGLVPLNLLEKAGPFLEGYCLMSQRFERKYLLVDLFFLPCLHTSQSSPLCLWFLNLIFTFSKCFVVFTKRNILWAVISWL